MKTNNQIRRPYIFEQGVTQYRQDENDSITNKNGCMDEIVNSSKENYDDLSEENVIIYDQVTAPDVLAIKNLLDTNIYPEEIIIMVRQELEKLKWSPFQSSERFKQSIYLQKLLSLPWFQRTDTPVNLNEAKAILDANHYGMTQVKERILDYLALHLAKKKTRQPILCLVGPPGTGKTSLAKSIAKSLKRKFVTLSVGGLSDETVIKGFQRTYSGAKPGRILELMHSAGVVNPVFLIDEIDKLCVNKNGDPASALLELLDPEQNKEFTDNYYEIPYDLSEVMFITTANNLSMLDPLIDRLEVIECPGYSLSDKNKITSDYLLPQILRETGLQNENIEFTSETIDFLIESYDKGSGIRHLRQLVEKIIRKTMRSKLEGRPYSRIISPRELRGYLGNPNIPGYIHLTRDEVGVANSLSVGNNGGNVGTIETIIYPGKGRINFTGNIGKIMKESSEAALSFLKTHAKALSINPNLFDIIDIHIHAPENAVLKDGPSAGATIAISIISALLKKNSQT